MFSIICNDSTHIIRCITSYIENFNLEYLISSTHCVFFFNYKETINLKQMLKTLRLAWFHQTTTEEGFGVYIQW